MIEISEEKLNTLISILEKVLSSDDLEIKNAALIAILEELDEMKNSQIYRT